MKSVQLYNLNLYKKYKNLFALYRWDLYKIASVLTSLYKSDLYKGTKKFIQTYRKIYTNKNAIFQCLRGL